MKNIYLIGFMGTGKTTVGKALARELERDFFDLDVVIEGRESRPISDIFAQKGEPYFRALEKRVLQEVAGRDQCVIAGGGGIVIDPENIILMKQSGVLICLAARLEVIIQRTSGARHRPLLNVPDPARTMEELLRKRAVFYAQADHTVDTSDLSIADIVAQLRKFVS